MNFKYNKDGLIPAIIQDIDTNEVLMLGYMNKESINITLEEKKVTFFSRSRNQLWTKGETSGNFLNLKSLSYDCDKDSILIKAKPEGPTCHTGKISCFYNNIFNETKNNSYKNILNKLEILIKERKRNTPENSYTTSLFKKGIDKIAQKVGEESTEVVIASKNNDSSELIYETADLIYHLIVLLTEKNISLDDIYFELYNRFD